MATRKAELQEQIEKAGLDNLPKLTGVEFIFSPTKALPKEDELAPPIRAFVTGATLSEDRELLLKISVADIGDQDIFGLVWLGEVGWHAYLDIDIPYADIEERGLDVLYDRFLPGEFELL